MFSSESAYDIIAVDSYYNDYADAVSAKRSNFGLCEYIYADFLITIDGI